MVHLSSLVRAGDSKRVHVLFEVGSILETNS